MLVLTRRPGETIRIGQNVVITVLRVAPGQVKIGIDAPSDVAIHREEIFRRIQADGEHPDSDEKTGTEKK